MKLSSTLLILLAAAFLLPQVSFGQIPYGLNLSCSNSMLVGSYAAQMNIDDSNAVIDLNATSTPKSATDAGFGSSTGPASTTALNNSKSKLLGMSRYYFDGNGNIVGSVSSTPSAGLPSGLANTSITNAILIPAGSYTVNSDCTASLSLTQGTTTYSFFGIVAANGTEVVIQETDSSSPGVTGSLVHGPNFCGSGYNNPQSFAFSYSGITPGVAASGSAAAVPASLYSNVGILTLDGSGNFTITYSENVGGTITRKGTNAAPVWGTYSIDPQSCVVSLSYSSSSPKGPAFSVLSATGGLGMFTVSPSASMPLVGSFIGVGSTSNQ